jgi:hypothetical protein
MAYRRIDVHHHVLPPAYTDWLRSKGLRDAGGRELPEWSVEGALRVMDDNEIASAVLSVSAPGVHLDRGKGHDPLARSKAREVNEFAARIAGELRRSR